MWKKELKIYGEIKVSMIINVKRRIVDVLGLNKAIARVQRLIFNKEESADLTSLSINELDEIVYETERTALSCRQAIELKEYMEEDYFDDEYVKISTKDIPVDVTYINGILRIKTPLTLKRKDREGTAKDNYLLMNYVEIALKEYTDKHGSLYEKVDIPLVAIIKRTSNSFKANKICDNDNLENGRIINKIVSALGCSDNAMVMDVYSCFRICKHKEGIGTEFILTSYDKFKLIVNELNRVV